MAEGDILVVLMVDRASAHRFGTRVKVIAACRRATRVRVING